MSKTSEYLYEKYGIDPNRKIDYSSLEAYKKSMGIDDTVAWSVTIPQDTEEVLETEPQQEQQTNTVIRISWSEPLAPSGFLYAAGGFLFGVVITALIFGARLKKVKAEYSTRLDEARAALDRMLKVAAKD